MEQDHGRDETLKIIIIGAGETGFNIASRLALEDKNVVVVDKNYSKLKQLAESVDVKIINGSGSNPLVLQDAGINDSEVVLAVTNSDEVNLTACLVVDMISPSTKKIAKIRSDSFIPYYALLRSETPHIDTVINPDIELAKYIESFIDIPGVVDIVDFAEGYLKFIGVRIKDTSSLANIKLHELSSVFCENRPLIVALVREEKLIIPRGNDTLHAGDLAYFITEGKNLARTMDIFSPDNSNTIVRRVLIVGGGNVSYYLAKQLEKRSISCKIIEKRADRCEYLAQKLDRTVVLHGDGSDENLLREEGVNETDVIVTLTNDEETNILISLLAKKMGTKKTITEVSKFSYSSFVSTIGIEQIVSSRLSAVNTILQHIRRGKILSTFAIKSEAGEVMEALALPTSDVVLKPLKKISFPKKAMVICIMRNKDMIIPNGDSVIKPGDRIIVFAKREAITGVEKALSVRLEYF